MARKLSQNFSLEEMTVTNTGLSNIPTEEEIKHIKWLTIYIAQCIRDKWGRMKVNSCFRSEKVNKKVGGVSSSQHRKGEALDFITPDADIKEVYKWIVEESGIQFGSCIFEIKGGSIWIHISLPRLNKRNQLAMIYKGGKYSLYKGQL